MVLASSKYPWSASSGNWSRSARVGIYPFGWPENLSPRLPHHQLLTIPPTSSYHAQSLASWNMPKKKKDEVGEMWVFAVFPSFIWASKTSETDTKGFFFCFLKCEKKAFWTALRFSMHVKQRVTSELIVSGLSCWSGEDDTYCGSSLVMGAFEPSELPHQLYFLFHLK